jgi:hypothetical protein
MKNFVLGFFAGIAALIGTTWAWDHYDVTDHLMDLAKVPEPQD